MGSHDPFGHLKHKLWPKEGLGVKLAIWLSTIKSQESTRFLCVQVVCDIPLESSWWGLQLCLKSYLNRSLHAKLWDPKIAGVLTFKILGLSFGSPGTKCHLDVASWRGIEYIIRGKVVASLRFGPWWVLWVWVCSWFVLTPKMLQLCINQLVVWLCAGSCE